MAMPSFDVVSEINFQELDNAVNQVSREITQRFDFRGTESSIKLDKPAKVINLISNSELKIETIVDILQSRAHKRSIDIKALKVGKCHPMSGQLLKCIVEMVEGVDKETGKKITKMVKEMKIKVQASIQDNKVRVTGKKRDDLQEVMQSIKMGNFDVPLQFDNFRD